MRRRERPIYCGQCGKLALANLNGEPLCPRCLIGTVKQSGDRSLLGHISPLTIASVTIRSLVKCKAEPLPPNRAAGNDFHGSGSYKY